MADRDRPPPPADLNLFKLVRALRPAPSGMATKTVPRVAPDDYAANVAELARRVAATGAQAVVLAFPMVDRPRAHLDALAVDSLPSGTALLSPELPDTAFFEADPIHLTPAGNDALAQSVAASLAR